MQRATKLKISLALNVVLVLALGFVVLNYKIRNHHYGSFMGMLMGKVIEGIDQGRGAGVADALRDLPFRASSGDIDTALRRIHKLLEAPKP